MKHVFISFSQKDRRQMVTMRDNLVRIGYRPWVDPNPRPGMDWRFDIDDAIRAADAVIVIVTPAAAESVYVTYEWTLALGLGVPVVPVIFDSAKMHPRLQTLEHFDTHGYASEGLFWEQFTHELQRRLNAAPQPNLQVQIPPHQNVAPAGQSVQPRQPIKRQVMPSEPGHYLVIRRGPKLNTIYALQKEVVTLGRDNANDIQVDDPEVSRYHLRMTWQGRGYAVEDLGSTNGTRVDGGARIVEETRLLDGQSMMLGDTIILSYEIVRA
ncbi:MAG: TIR domain-containing protein [Chloroflexota bacterium]